MPFPSPEVLRSFLLIRFPVLLLAVALHEFAHCWTNDRLGDDTPRLAGRVTLNPFAHLAPLGTIMMVVSSLSGFGIGWGKPSPFNPANFEHPARDRMIGAIAGPVCNVLQMLAWASIAVLIRPFIDVHLPHILLEICWAGVATNAGLAIFNMLPINPLDGHHVLSYLAPPSLRPLIDNPAWSYVFLALVLINPLREKILMPIMSPIWQGAVSVAHFLVGWPNIVGDTVYLFIHFTGWPF